MRKMAHRERVLVALERKEPDRVPLDLGGWAGLTKEAYSSLKRHMGFFDEAKISVDNWNVVRHVDERILTHLDIDFRTIYFGDERISYREEEIFVDEWGIEYKEMKNIYNTYVEVVKHPLANADMKDLENYDWPDPYTIPNLRIKTQPLRNEAKELYEHTDYAIVGGYIGGQILERCWYLRGMEQFMIDLSNNREFATTLMDRILEVEKGFMDLFLRAVGKYIHIIIVSDDLGSQRGPLISPKMYRALIKPRHKELYRFIKKRTNAKILQHSDGAVFPFIEDLIDVGVDILNPLQPLAGGKDLRRIKRIFGKDLSLWGGFDIQNILPSGSQKSIQEEVKETLKMLAPGGGYIFSPAHNIQGDVPPENIVSMYKSAHTYGRYPNNIDNVL